MGFWDLCNQCMKTIKVTIVFLLAGPSQDVFLLPHIPYEGKGEVTIVCRSHSSGHLIVGNSFVSTVQSDNCRLRLQSETEIGSDSHRKLST